MGLRRSRSFAWERRRAAGHSQRVRKRGHDQYQSPQRERSLLWATRSPRWRSRRKRSPSTAVGTAGPTGTGVDFTPQFPRSRRIPTAMSYWLLGQASTSAATACGSTTRRTCPSATGERGSALRRATAFAHLSNEPVQALSTGITAFDSPLTHDHARDQRGGG